MRQLKIEIKNKGLLQLPNVPEEFKFVESIAKMYANDSEQLEEFYKVGLAVAKDFKEKCRDDFSNRYDRYAAWWVKQVILIFKKSRY